MSLSTATHRALKPPELGKPSTKFMVMSAHGFEGTGRRWRSPLGSVLSTLTVWQILHSFKKFLARPVKIPLNPIQGFVKAQVAT